MKKNYAVPSENLIKNISSWLLCSGKKKGDFLPVYLPDYIIINLATEKHKQCLHFSTCSCSSLHEEENITDVQLCWLFEEDVSAGAGNGPQNPPKLQIKH